MAQRRRARDPETERIIRQVADEVGGMSPIAYGGKNSRVDDLLQAGVDGTMIDPPAGILEKIKYLIVARVAAHFIDEIKRLRGRVSELERRPLFTARDIHFMQTLREYGLAVDDIADVYDCPPDTVRYVLDGHITTSSAP